jgi:hypothetical protein
MAIAVPQASHPIIGTGSSTHMLNFLDSVLDKILDTDWVTPPAKPDRSFVIPDDTFQSGLQNLTLNIYLAEIRENREFKRASWDTITLPDRTTTLSQPPAYFDCHYVISAWSPVQGDGIASGVSDEHAALGGALRVLVRNPDVVPGAIGVPGGGDVFQNAHIYLTVAPPEAPRVVHDFWNTMQKPWRPVISVIATAPVDPLFDTPPSPPMITFVQRYGVIGPVPGTFEEVVQIGGWVLRLAGDVPIPGATVTRVATGEQVTTDAQGRFSFSGLLPGIHKIRAAASGLTTLERDLDVPNGPPDSHVFRLS